MVFVHTDLASVFAHNIMWSPCKNSSYCEEIWKEHRGEQYWEYQWIGVSLGWRINKLSARSCRAGRTFTGGPAGRTFISGALYTGNQWDVILSSNSLATVRRGAVAARVCVRTRPFKIIIIHKLIDAAGNIADVSRISIRFKENDESRIAETIRRYFLSLCGS